MPKTPIELARERRERVAKKRLGTPNPKCAACGFNDRTCLEAHHVAGQAYDPTKVITCRNCHRRLSDWQKDHPEKLEAIPSFDEQLAHFLLGLADFFELLVEKLREFARQLFDQLKINTGDKS